MSRLTYAFGAAVAAMLFTTVPAHAGRIVFESSRCIDGACGRGIFTVNDDGSKLSRLGLAPPHPPQEYPKIVLDSMGTPAWSPDGRRIALWRNEQPNPDNERNSSGVVVANSDGSGSRLVAATSYAGGIEWAADSRSILFNAVNVTGIPNPRPGHLEGDVFVADAAGGGIRRVIGTPADEYADGFADDGRIIFRRNRFPANGPPAGRYALDPATGKETLLTLGEQSDMVRFSPDGRRVALVAENKLIVAGADGNRIHKPFGDAYVVAESLRWSRDSQTLFLSGPQAPGTPRLSSLLTWRLDGPALVATQLTSAPGQDVGMDWTDGGGRVPRSPDRSAPTALLTDREGVPVASGTATRSARVLRRRNTGIVVLDKSGIKKVEVAVGRRVAKRKPDRCRFTSRTGKLLRARSCKRPRYVRVNTAAGWRSFAKRLGRGKRLIGFKTVDTAGNSTRMARLRSIAVR